MKRKLVSLTLALLLTLGLAVPSLAAQDGFDIENGMLTEYNGPGGNVVIPDDVTSIDEMAFYGCTSLTGVIIPDGVTTIGESAFYFCTNLTSVTIPGSVTHIVWFAFTETSLTDVYYGGTQKQWSSIFIDFGNDPLERATIHYNSTMPGGQPMAYPSAQTVYVDDKPVEFAMYALKDANGNPTNYIRVRDLAAVLSGTGAQFEVGWDGKVALIPGTAYTGSADKAPFDWEMSYSGYTAPTLVGGEEQYLEAIQIEYDGGGYTYYKLRDLGQSLGFNVSWSADKGVFIETDKPYNAND